MPAKRPQPKPEKAKRPRKPTELHEGPEAAKRFAAGLKAVIAAGPHRKP